MRTHSFKIQKVVFDRNINTRKSPRTIESVRNYHKRVFQCSRHASRRWSKLRTNFKHSKRYQVFRHVAQVRIGHLLSTITASEGSGESTNHADIFLSLILILLSNNKSGVIYIDCSAYKKESGEASDGGSGGRCK